MYLLASVRTADERHEIDKHIKVMKHEATSLGELFHGHMHEAVYRADSYSILQEYLKSP